jgi:uncharacterized protein DUF4350
VSATTARQGVGSWLLPVLALVGTFLVLVAIGGGSSSSDEPLDPRSDERLGTSALATLADELGADVDITDRLPEPDAMANEPAGSHVVVLFADTLETGQANQLERWVQAGGTLVVADDASSFAPDQADAFGEAGDLGSACDIAALDGIDVGGVEPWAGGTLYDVPAGSDGCLGDGLGTGLGDGDGFGNEAYIVATPRGDGTIVSVGGVGMFVNVALAEGENAPVVAALVAPQEGTELDLVRPGPVSGSGDDTLLDLISPNVRRALAQLAIAFLVYALWRSRRLGAPVAEPQPVAVAGSELVAAVGSLLDRSGSPEHAADLLRTDLCRFLGDRLGVPADSSPQVLAAVAAERTGADEARVAWALGSSPPADDAQLVALAQTIDEIRQEVLSHV